MLSFAATAHAHTARCLTSKWNAWTLFVIHKVLRVKALHFTFEGIPVDMMSTWLIVTFGRWAQLRLLHLLHPVTRSSEWTLFSSRSILLFHPSSVNYKCWRGESYDLRAMFVKISAAALPPEQKLPSDYLPPWCLVIFFLGLEEPESA